MIKDLIRSNIEEALTAAQQSGSLPEFEVPAVEILRPKQADHGDYSCNVAMVAAAAIRKSTGEKTNPRQIAQAIIDHLPQNTLFSSVDLAGPGFINLRLADTWLQRQTLGILTSGENFGNIDRGHDQRWQVEYVSANPAGPLHYGGARNAVLGDTLANVLEAAGYDVQREYYVNDGGTQMDMYIQSLYSRYAQELGQDIPFPEGGYPGEYVFEYARKVIAQYGDQFLHMDREQALAELKKVGLEIVLEEADAALQRIGVVFDRWFHEQSLYDEGLVDQALDFLQSKGEAVERDGALWFLASKYPKNEKDEVLVRSNGLPTYFAGDIAYHYDKFMRRKFDRVVNVWAVDHQGHVPRMSAMMQAFGLDPDRLVILMYDLVKLVRDGVEVKLSKRAGNLLTIDDVVDEVGSDALRFNLLTRSPESTIDFDLDLAVEQTNENPVYYVQYSHARLASILAKADEVGLDWQSAAKHNPDRVEMLCHPSELTLLRKLLELEEQIELAVEKLSPHNLTYYAIDLTKIFNAFYRDCRVIDTQEPELSQARLMLSKASQIVLARVLTLLGVSTPETM